MPFMEFWCLLNNHYLLFCCFYQRPKGDPFVGVYQGHSTESRAKPRTDQVGGSDRGYFSFPEVRGSGTIMGQEEK